MKRSRHFRRFPADRDFWPFDPGGFSLLELMVSIAVVAALAALALPSYHAVVRHSDQVKCAAHLRQVGTAIHAYAHDQSGRLPGLGGGAQRAHYRLSTLENPSALVDFLHPYLGLAPSTSNDWITAPPFVCPASRKSINPYGESLDKNVYYNHVGTVIPTGVIQRPFGYINKAIPTLPMKLEAIEYLTKTIALADRSLEAIHGKPQPHGSMLNILFMDGHVSAVPYQNFILRKDSTYEVTY